MNWDNCAQSEIQDWYEIYKIYFLLYFKKQQNNKTYLTFSKRHIYTEECLKVLKNSTPQENDTNCTKMINKSIELFASQNHHLSTRSANSDRVKCTSQWSLGNLSICNCCKDFILKCATKQFIKIKRLLEDTQIFEYSRQGDITMQSSTNKVDTDINLYFHHSIVYNKVGAAKKIC
jgi:hypothetical protein